MTSSSSSTQGSGIRPRKKKCCVALSDRPYSKKKKKKSRVGKAPNFAQIGCFFEKNDGICTQIWPFWVLFKKII